MTLYTMHDAAMEMAEFAAGRSARQRAGDQKRAQKLRGRRRGGKGKNGGKLGKVLKGAAIGAAGVGGLGVLGAGARYGMAAAEQYKYNRALGGGKRASALAAATSVPGAVSRDIESLKKLPGKARNKLSGTANSVVARGKGIAAAVGGRGTRNMDTSGRGSGYNPFYQPKSRR